MGVTARDAREIIHRLFLNLGMTAMEILYMPALNKDNIRGLVSFDRPDILWEALAKKRGVVMLACHMDNWEWLGAALASTAFPSVQWKSPSPIRCTAIFSMSCAGAWDRKSSPGAPTRSWLRPGHEKGPDAGAHRRPGRGLPRIFVPFFGKMASTPEGPAYFARKFKAPVVPIFMVRKPSGYGHQVFVKEPIYYEDTGNQEKDDYRITLKMTQEVEKIIRQYPDNWIWFQHRWNTPWNG